MDNEPLYKDLGEQTTRAGLSSVKWADLTDNTMMFGLDGSTPFFDGIFNQAGTAWRKRGYISQTVTPGVAKDDSFLKEIYAALPKEARPLGKEAIPAVPPPTEEQKAGKEVVTKQVNIYFATGSAELDQNARQALEDQVKSLPETYANAYIRSKATQITRAIRKSMSRSVTHERERWLNTLWAKALSERALSPKATALITVSPPTTRMKVERRIGGRK